MNKWKTNLGIFLLIPVFLYLSFIMWSTLHHHRDWEPSDIKASVDIDNLFQAVNFYKLDHGIYPESLEILVGEYLNKEIKDPWGNNYGYISNGNKVIIYTNGGPKHSDRQIFQVEHKKI